MRRGGIFKRFYSKRKIDFGEELEWAGKEERR